MRRIVLMAVKDLRVLLADKGNVFWVFGFPAVFALLFGAIFSGMDKGPSGIRIGIVDADQSEFSQAFIDHLSDKEVLRVESLAREDALDRVKKGKLSAALFLQAGFGGGLGGMFDQTDPKIEIASDPARKMELGYLQGLIVQSQFELLQKRFANQQWMQGQMDQWRDEIRGASDLMGVEADVYLNFFDALDRLLTDSNEMGLDTGFQSSIMEIPQVDVQRDIKGPRKPFQITFPQGIIWGILSCAASFAVSIVKERATGTFQRVCVGPVAEVHVLAGKALACFMTCWMVIGLLVLGGKLVFKVPIDSPALFVLAGICTALCFVGLMMFISTLGKTEQSASGAGMAVLMVMAMLGGGMMPLVFMPAWLQRLSHISPIKWGIYSLEGAIWRDFSAFEMLLPCTILVVIGLVFFLLGVFMLRTRA